MKNVSLFFNESLTEYCFDSYEQAYSFATDLAQIKHKRPLFALSYTSIDGNRNVPLQALGEIIRAVELGLIVAIIIIFEPETVAAKEQI